METARKSTLAAMPDYLGLAENKRHDWVLDIPLAVTLEDVLEPSYWAHIAEQMEPMDHIEVRAEDGSWIAYLIVRMCERNYAKVILDRLVKLEASIEVPMSFTKHNVEWKGPTHRWAVIRVADSQMLQSGFKMKELAHAWVQEHEKTMSR